jgi:Ca2+-binding EF-hand superfamily protein
MGSSASRELLAKVQLESGDGDGASTPKALPLSIDVARQVFALFDRNRDGKLDRSESVKFISAYLVAHGEPKATPERALALLAAIDRNG